MPFLFCRVQNKHYLCIAIRERGTLSDIAERELGYGVIGNTTDSGPVIPGSSPGIPTNNGGFRSHLKPPFFLQG